MMPVVRQPEPNTFDGDVRQPGVAFLKTSPNPTRKQFRKHGYWTKCLPDLRRAYGGVCAYSSMWIPFGGSVDHFEPKSVKPLLAYEWSNYRLASERLNHYKADSTSVVDPFEVQSGWFELDFATFFVLPGPQLPVDVTARIEETIRTLRLNSDDSLVRGRFDITKDYADGHVTLGYLQSRYPLISSELIRQGLQDSIKGTL